MTDLDEQFNPLDNDFTLAQQMDSVIGEIDAMSDAVGVLIKQRHDLFEAMVFASQIDADLHLVQFFLRTKAREVLAMSPSKF